MNIYHCSIYAIDAVESERDSDFRPFANADEMVAMTGMSIDSWRQHKREQARLSVLHKQKHQKKQFLFAEFV